MSPQLALRPEFLPVYLTPQWYQVIAFPGFPWQKLYASQVPQEHCIPSLNPEYFIFLYLYSSAITACSSALFSLKAPFQRAGFHMGWLWPRARAAAGSSTPAGSPLLRLPPSRVSCSLVSSLMRVDSGGRVHWAVAQQVTEASGRSWEARHKLCERVNWELWLSPNSCGVKLGEMARSYFLRVNQMRKWWGAIELAVSDLVRVSACIDSNKISPLLFP